MIADHCSKIEFPALCRSHSVEAGRDCGRGPSRPALVTTMNPGVDDAAAPCAHVLT